VNKKISTFSTILAAFAIVAGSVWFAPAAAADLNRGARAYAAGDFATAAEQWRILAEAGDMMAQFNLAVLYDNAASGLFNSAEAAAWYKRAAAQGLGAAQFNLAVAHQIGRGVPRDLVETLFWLSVASRAEDAAIAESTSAAAEKLAAVLTIDETSSAARRADSWRAVPEEMATTRTESGDRPYMTLSEADIMTIQRRLANLGYELGVIDGVAVAKTQRAIAAYFKDRGNEWRHGPLSQDLLEMLD